MLSFVGISIPIFVVKSGCMSQFYMPNIDFYAFDDKWSSSRMIFVAGPRQVGKTTFANNKIKKLGGSYFNWDNREVRLAYEKESSFFVKSTKLNSLVVFDEIHKRRKWKDILKGIYDTHKQNYKFLITGSARLDTFRRSGDSLVGRYFLTHFFPISAGDLLRLDFKEQVSPEVLLKDILNLNKVINKSDYDALLKLNGFPEPFFKSSESFLRRWQSQHKELLIREDLRDLSNVQSLDKIEVLVELLGNSVANIISYNSLAQDLEVDHKSVKQWLLQLEKIMLTFVIQPWSNKIQKSIRKNPKVYFYDWSTSSNEGYKFENFIACHLYKATTLWNDRYGHNFGLYFIRSYSGKEVDFCITLNKKPWLLVEAKNGYPEVSQALKEYSKLLKVPGVIVTNEENWNVKNDDVYIFSARRFLSCLP